MEKLSAKTRRIIVRCMLGVIIFAAAVLMAVFLSGKIRDLKEERRNKVFADAMSYYSDLNDIDLIAWTMNYAYDTEHMDKIEGIFIYYPNNTDTDIGIVYGEASDGMGNLTFKTYTLSERALGLSALDFCGYMDAEGNEFTLVFSHGDVINYQYQVDLLWSDEEHTDLEDITVTEEVTGEILYP